MKRCAVLAILCLSLVALSACKKEAPPPPTPAPPPPQTAEQLTNGVMEKVTPLISPDPQSGKALREALSKHVASLKTEQNGPAAQKLVTNIFVERLKQAHQNEQWDFVINLCNAVDVLDPDNTRTSRYRQRAQDEKNRPVVQMKGIMEMEGQTNVLLDIYLPETGTMDSRWVREGEEFDGLILESIIGNNQGVRLKYVKTEATFEVYK